MHGYDYVEIAFIHSTLGSIATVGLLCSVCYNQVHLMFLRDLAVFLCVFIKVMIRLGIG